MLDDSVLESVRVVMGIHSDPSNHFSLSLLCVFFSLLEIGYALPWESKPLCGWIMY